MKRILKKITAVLCVLLLTVNGACKKDPVSEISVPEPAEGVVDVDLTDLSANMVYAQVYDMVMSPEKYRRRTVKMRGIFAIRTDEKTGDMQYGCVIQDALACCAQGIQFIPAEEMRYPEDFPELGEEITVTGVFDFTLDGTAVNCILRGAVPE